MKERQFTATQRLETLAEDFASRIDYDWRALARQCTQVVIFGSRAADLHTAFSDLDILLVVEHRLSVPLPGSLSGFDLVVRSENEVRSSAWIESELAGHIAAYGYWLQGESRWRERVLEEFGEQSAPAEAKRRRIRRLTASMLTHWERLTETFRVRTLTTLRREKQRLRLLESGVAIPPTALLDLWAESDRRLGSSSEIESLAGMADIRLVLAKCSHIEEPPLMLETVCSILRCDAAS